MTATRKAKKIIAKNATAKKTIAPKTATKKAAVKTTTVKAKKTNAQKTPAKKTATKSNIFARIMRRQAPAVVAEDQPGSELFAFRDHRPSSTVHLLVIPRRYVRDASQLTPADAGLVRSMEAKARELVRAEVGSSFRDDELSLGFH